MTGFPYYGKLHDILVFCRPAKLDLTFHGHILRIRKVDSIMRRTGKPECLSFIFYTENYGRGKVITKPDGSLLDEPITYPANRDELIMRVESEFAPHGIMIGLHDDDAPNKDHEHWYLGFENNRMQPNDFEPIARSMGFVVKPSEAYMKRPDTLEDYITHTSDAATKDGKKVYDASHIWKSPYWDGSLYMPQEMKRDIKREQRMNGDVDMDVQIIKYIETFNIRYFPELLHFLDKYHQPGLYAYVLMNRATFYGMYLRELREAERYSYTPGYVVQECKQKYPHGTNSVDAGKLPPKNDDIPDPGCAEKEAPFINEEAPEHEQPALPAEGASPEAREADTSVTPGINESDLADADLFADDDFEFIGSSDGDNPFVE